MKRIIELLDTSKELNKLIEQEIDNLTVNEFVELHEVGILQEGKFSALKKGAMIAGGTFAGALGLRSATENIASKTRGGAYSGCSKLYNTNSPQYTKCIERVKKFRARFSKSGNKIGDAVDKYTYKYDNAKKDLLSKKDNLVKTIKDKIEEYKK